MYRLRCFNCYWQTKINSEMAGYSELPVFDFTIFIFFLQVANLLTQAAGMKSRLTTM